MTDQSVYAECQGGHCGLDGICHNCKVNTYIERLEGEIDNAKMRTALLEATFKHTHQANYVDGSLVDDCAECGLDIRDPIHLRWQGGDT